MRKWFDRGEGRARQYENTDYCGTSACHSLRVRVYGARGCSLTSKVRGCLHGISRDYTSLYIVHQRIVYPVPNAVSASFFGFGCITTLSLP